MKITKKIKKPRKELTPYEKECKKEQLMLDTKKALKGLAAVAAGGAAVYFGIKAFDTEDSPEKVPCAVAAGAFGVIALAEGFDLTTDIIADRKISAIFNSVGEGVTEMANAVDDQIEAAPEEEILEGVEETVPEPEVVKETKASAPKKTNKKKAADPAPDSTEEETK